MKFILIAVLFVLAFSANDYDKEVHWDWKNINFDAKEIATKIKRHSRSFVWGTATAAHQVEGNNTNNWSEWEKQPGRITNGDRSGEACQHYTRYKEDIALMKNQLGVKSYRFSIEWSRIQPTKERRVFSVEATRHYHQMIDEVLRNGMVPVITLHHFTNPVWFQEMGQFEYHDNLIWFEEFSEYVFQQYSPKCKLWVTFNEVNVYSIMGYIIGFFPPGTRNLQLSFNVMLNMVIAHTNVYQKLKRLPNGRESQIGFVKEYHQLDPVPDNSIIRGICNYYNRVYNELILNYFETGKMEYHIPFLVDLKYENPLGPKSIDYIGLNYYSHTNFIVNITNFPNIIHLGARPENQWLMTDMGYTVYAEGIYRALKRYSVLKLPIYITENGLADSKDTLRDTMIKRYLYAVSKAMEEGVDVRGYFFWSFMDNFEWAFGFGMKFGLYHVDYKTQQRTFRRGSQFFVDVVREFNKL